MIKTSACIARFLMIAVLCGGAAAQAAPQHDPCAVTSKSRLWSAACFDATAAGRHVKQENRKHIRFGRNSVATIVIAVPPELVAVNRHGKVVKLKKAHLADFSFEPAQGEVKRWEIARFGYDVKNASGGRDFKCGYYRTGRFDVVIPPVYDECDYFDKGKAMVCIGCSDHCPSGDCHKTDYVGGEALIINEQHAILKRFVLPTVPLCEYGRAAPTVSPSGEPLCRPGPPDPFAQVK
jgi:hypothetical protein